MISSRTCEGGAKLAKGGAGITVQCVGAVGEREGGRVLLANCEMAHSLWLLLVGYPECDSARCSSSSLQPFLVRKQSSRGGDVDFATTKRVPRDGGQPLRKTEQCEAAWFGHAGVLACLYSRASRLLTTIKLAQPTSLKR
jgi:hypothetical protein